MKWKPVLIGGPIDASRAKRVLDHVLDDAAGSPPSFIRIREDRPIDFNAVAEGTPEPDPACVYRLRNVAGVTAFYEFVRIEPR